MGRGTTSSLLAGDATASPSAGEGHATIATWRTDLATGLVSGNAALALFFGLPEGRTTDIPLRWLLAAIHPLDVVRVVVSLEASVARRERFEAVYRVQGRDRQRTVQARSRVFRDAAGHPMFHVGEARELRT